MDLEYFLKDVNFDKQFKRLQKKLKGKSVVIYGTGQLFQYIHEKYDLSTLNIIAVSDGKYSENDKGQEFLGYKIVPITDVAELNPDYVVVAILNYVDIVYNFERIVFNKIKTKIIPLAQKRLRAIIKEIWT